jgi:glycosyltransferase involved in cell wall biosynthesis
MRRILVLYREMAGYMLESLRFFAQSHQVEIDIVVYPVNADAPFQFHSEYPITFYSYENCTIEDLQALQDEKNYSLFFCGSWSDKKYLHFIQRNRKVTSVLAFDKQWQGSLKDWLRVAWLRLKVKHLFDTAFVAGAEQRQFARMMGFQNHRIWEGVYCCSFEPFERVFDVRKHKRQAKKIWYVGRYAPEKQVELLFNVFSELHHNELSEWELHAVGVGPLFDQRPSHPAIFHYGFLQPHELVNFITDGSAFVLASSYEPWGLVVQEFALAGYPLLLSEKVGARTSFLVPGKNGYSFQPGNKNDLKRALLQLTRLSPEQITQMGIESNALAKNINPTLWANTMHHLMANFQKDVR